MNARRMSKRETKELLDKLEAAFGFEPRLFSQYDFYINERNKVFIVSRAASETIQNLSQRLMNIGILFARWDYVAKPTSNMLQIFGRHARKNIVELDRERAKAYAEGEDIDFVEKPAEDGYVILKYNGNVLGCGQLRGVRLKNQLPRAKRMMLEFL